MKNIKQFSLLTLILLTTSCSHAIRWRYDMLSFWSQSELKTYAFLSSESGWVACNVDKFPNKTIGEQKAYLSKISERNLTSLEQTHCALYRCSTNSKNEKCVNEGDYGIFSEVSKDIIQKDTVKKYTGDGKDLFNWDMEESNCLADADLNSCSIISNYYKYWSKNRKKFFEIRKKECTLLMINETDCNYDF